MGTSQDRQPARSRSPRDVRSLAAEIVRSEGKAMKHHVIVWDGTEARGGRMLFAEQSSNLPQPVSPQFGEGPKRLRECAVILSQEWRTVRQIADVTGMNLETAHNTINQLIKRGEMQREQDWSRGRSAQQRYRFGLAK